MPDYELKLRTFHTVEPFLQYRRTAHGADTFISAIESFQNENPQCEAEAREIIDGIREYQEIFGEPPGVDRKA